jgi:hypothetical protein
MKSDMAILLQHYLSTRVDSLAVGESPLAYIGLLM